MAQVNDKCEVCGQPARVRILEKYVNGAPVFRGYCLDCADKQGDWMDPEADATSRPRLSLAALLIAAGLSIGILGALGDYLGIRGGGGVGWYQSMGLGIGALLVLLGALLRADVIAVFGTILFVLAACVDLLGISGTAGFGWKQVLAIIVGTALTATGALLRLRT